MRLSTWRAGNRGTGFATVVLNAATLVGSNVVSAGLGVLYWPLAARSFAVADVGTASAALAATMLLGSLAALGTTTLLVGELPRRSTIERSRLIITALLVTGLTGAVLGLGFALLAPLLSPDLRSFATGWDSVAVVVVMVSASAVSGVIDHALIGLLKGEVQFGRNTVLAVVKLLALIVVAGLPLPNRALVLYGTWLVGTLASFVVIVPLAGFGRLPLEAYKPRVETMRHLGWSALQHHALNLSLQVPTSILPLVVTVLLSATANAYFYVASMFASVVYMIPLALSTTLYAVGSHLPSALASRARLTLLLSVLGGIAANVFFAVAARPLLGIIGRSYADEVESVLRILMLAVFPVTIKMHYIAFCQVKRRVGRAALLMSVAGIAEIAGAAIGGVLGDLNTLAVAYVLVLTAEGLLLSPVVIRLIWRTPPEPDVSGNRKGVTNAPVAKEPVHDLVR